MFKTALRVTVIVLFVFGVAYLFYWRLFLVKDDRQVTITTVRGTVEKSDEKGRWELARPGDRLEMDDGIRTGEGSGVTLRLVDDSRVKVEHESELSIQEITEAVTRFRLRQGKIAADIKPNPHRRVEVQASEGEAKVATEGATFTMTTTQDGTMAVAAQAGEVRVAAKGEEVKLTAGNQSTVLPGEAPEVAAIPASVLLKVDWPPSTRLNIPEVVISGKTDIGSRVVVMGRDARVDSEGRFVARVGLEEGSNVVQVITEDVAGNRNEAESPEIVVDTRAPHLRVKDKDLWE